MVESFEVTLPFDISSTLVGAAGSMYTGTVCVSAELFSPDAALAAATPNCTPKTPATPLEGVSVVWPVELLTLSARLLLAGVTLPVNFIAAPLTLVVGTVKVTGVFALVLIGLIGCKKGASTLVSAATVTWNVSLVVAPVVASVAVTVTCAVPVVPTGAESSSTPSWLSVIMLTLVIVTVLSGSLSSPLELSFTGTLAIFWRTLSPLVRKPRIV